MREDKEKNGFIQNPSKFLFKKNLLSHMESKAHVSVLRSLCQFALNPVALFCSSSFFLLLPIIIPNATIPEANYEIHGTILTLHYVGTKKSVKSRISIPARFLYYSP